MLIRGSQQPEAETIQINDLNQIDDEIVKLTKQITGGETNISTTPIYLTVYKKKTSSV